MKFFPVIRQALRSLHFDGASFMTGDLAEAIARQFVWHDGLSDQLHVKVEAIQSELNRLFMPFTSLGWQQIDEIAHDDSNELWLEADSLRQCVFVKPVLLKVEDILPGNLCVSVQPLTASECSTDSLLKRADCRAYFETRDLMRREELAV